MRGRCDIELDEILVVRGANPSRPALENRVAHQADGPMDLLGHRTARRRDELVLGALVDKLRNSSRPAAVLDIGCAYGNHLLMLDAAMGNDQAVRYDGVDLDERGLEFATAFAEQVPGYANCSFRNADIESGLPFDDATFDAATMSDVIEHLVDVDAAAREVARVLRPGGVFVMCTPLKDSLFKRVASLGNRLTRGRLYRAYYRGKGADLDDEGSPIMDVHAGHEHISEMDAAQIEDLLVRNGFRVRSRRYLSVFSGSAWFDSHPVLQAGILVLEAVHDRLQRPSWGHAVFVEAEKR